MKKSLIASILITLLILTSCTKPSTETPLPGLDEAPAKVTETSAPTKTQDTQPTEPTSEPELLKVVGQIGGPVQAIAVAGNYAYAGIGSRLVILDISNPLAIKELGATQPLDWYVEHVSVSGETAYVAAGMKLYIVAVSDPTHPDILSVYETPGYIEGVSISGQHVYLADGPAGMRIMDVKEPTNPVEVAHVYSNNYVFHVATDGNFAYLAAGSGGLLISDISNPLQPLEVGSLDTPGYAFCVAIGGSNAYVADGWRGLRLVDVSNPVKPTEVASYDTGGWTTGVTTSGEVLYVGDILTGLHVIDSPDGTSLKSVWHKQPLFSQVKSLVFQKDFLYFAENNGLQVMDISNPVRPLPVSLYSPLDFAGSVAVHGNYAYVAGVCAHSHPLRVVDLSDITQPREMLGGETKGSATKVETEGRYVYALNFGGNEGLGVADTGASGELVPFSFLKLSGPPTEVLLKENKVYITTEFSLEILDVSNPKSPIKLGTLDFTQGRGRQAGEGVANDVAVSGNIAYVVLAKLGLAIIDVSNPTNPVLLTTFKPSEMLKPGSIIVDKGFAYVGDDAARLLVIDLSNPKDPSLVNTLYMETYIEHMVLADGILYMASGSGGLQVFDMADPTHPDLIATCRLPGLTLGVAVDSQYVYLGNGEGGLYIIGRPLNKTASTTSFSSHSSTTSVFSAHLSGVQRCLAIPVTGLAPLSNSVPVGQVVPSLSSNLFVSEEGNLVVRADASSASIPLIGSGQVRTVTSVADTGTGTLRWALENAVAGDIIVFDPSVFPPQAATTIKLSSGLPYLSQGSLTIDGSNAGVILDGSVTAKGTCGLLITSDYNVVKGLQITGFPGAGIGIAGASYNTIGGDQKRGNGPTGEGNVVSGNGIGIGIADSIDGVTTDIGVKSGQKSSEAQGNRILGNYIGTDATGTKPLGSQGTGVWVYGINVFQNIIGGFTSADRNVISGNTRAGVTLINAPYDNIVAGNYIGTDTTGTRALGNRDCGITIEGGASNIVAHNVISGNGQTGVIVTDPGAWGNEIIGNLIGTDATGTKALGNGFGGLGINESYNKIGGATAEERNIISGNSGNGIKIGLMSTTGVIVIGNYIGIDITGTKALGNSSDGIFLQEGTYHNFIGGDSEVERNIISANAGSGVRFIEGVSFNFITGNYIGADVAGTMSLPNQSGIEIGKSSTGIGGSKFNFISDNLISSNKKGGIIINAGGNNRMWCNNLIDNVVNASDSGCDNYWDLDGQGNYWSDYEGNDSNSDGIGDIPYQIAGKAEAKDNYPFVKPLQGIPR
jgi:hypothetical protein